MSSGTGSGGIWPADVIHVNEDGWVLINRGQQHGVPVGLRLLVVGAGARELRDLFANEATSHETETGGEREEGEQADEAEAPVVLRTRRTYELLEVVHVEPACAVAIAARTPAERRPQFYRGTQGELLVWAPLPATFTYPQPNANGEDEEDEDADVEEQSQRDGQPYDQDEAGEMADAAPVDAPPQRAGAEQEDERWEEALPLNGVGVGDQVVPAAPIGPAQPPRTAAAPAGANTATSSAPGAKTRQGNAGATNPFEEGKDYDWMKPRS